MQDFLFGHRSTIAVIGGLFLCLLGLRIILAKPATIAAGPRKSAAGLAGDLVGTFMLTLANPMTILSFIAIFAALNTSAASDSYLAAATLVLGVFGGSAAWWLCLSFGIGVIRHRDGPAGAALDRARLRRPHPRLRGDRGLAWHGELSLEAPPPRVAGGGPLC